MADMGRLISEADEYGDQRFAEGQADGSASRQAEIDQLTVELDTVRGELDELDELQAAYDAHMDTHVDEPDPTPRAMVLGMSAPATKWTERLQQVGADGITARRIFVDPDGSGRIDPLGKRDLIAQAVAAGMTPVVSYKGSLTSALLTQLRDYLDGLSVRPTATWQHEPRGDLTPAAFRAGSLTFANAVKTSRVKVGPLLNGWLLDRDLPEFESYTDAGLLDVWDFLGIDTYQANATSTTIPGDRIPPLVSWLVSKGHAGMPIVVGEFNGFGPGAISRSMQMFLDEPSVALACVWNSGPTGLGTPLTDARLAAFIEGKRDPRVVK